MSSINSVQYRTQSFSPPKKDSQLNPVIPQHSNNHKQKNSDLKFMPVNIPFKGKKDSLIDSISITLIHEANNNPEWRPRKDAIDRMGELVKTNPNKAELFLETLSQFDKGLNDTNEHVRDASAKTLKEILKSDPETAERVLDLLLQPTRGINHPEIFDKIRAFDVMKTLIKTRPDLIENVFHKLTQPDKGINHTIEEVRNQSCKLFTEMVQIKPALAERMLDVLTQPEKGLKDPDWGIREQASIFIGKVANVRPDLLERTFNILTQPDQGINDPDADVRRASYRALIEIGLQSYSKIPEVKTILRANEHWDNDVIERFNAKARDIESVTAMYNVGRSPNMSLADSLSNETKRHIGDFVNQVDPEYYGAIEAKIKQMPKTP